MDFIAQYLPRILVGVAVLIPLVIALIKYVKKAADDKNWNIIVKMVLDLMV
jgi:ABC-type transport system involved in cytochrome bd biosynthesis fused ATPase/permease subunit